MRIGIDTTALPPEPAGAGTYILQLVPALVSLDSGHEFVLFAHKSRQAMFDLPSEKGVQWVLLPDKNPPRRLFWEQTQLPLLAKRTRLDLLHSPHYTRPLYLPCASVVTFHDMTFFLLPQLHTPAKRVFFPIAMRLSAHLADALITVSENTRQDTLRTFNIPPKVVFTTKLGVSSKFRPVTDKKLLTEVRQNYNLPDKFFLYLGVIEPRKNIPLLIDAYSRLIKDGIDSDLVLVGSYGWMYDDVLRKVKIHKLEKRVHFLGYIPAETLPILYNLAHTFVYPSIYEGFGIPPVEAMACGTPVIAANSSSMIETIGDAGLLVPPDDEWALAEAMVKMVNNSELRGQLRNRGLQRAKYFSWEQTANETLKVYEKVALEQ